ncbi:hypothetical protein BDK51DRAFT_51963 [Blyttiomyces helicus]|uniref:pyridoxal kinase n=1 Tax=Blyttiomyces helicus TaxID=388810 RepID=A0A4P9VX53_9FUNG|nr:hypothetical protein BDK51DRAFT_51963 [Blyttiomyces helicus]|eukprot:RKO84301.1 hypothetical protein BDK51DRAFT_51963 [Blyttiomyces helicus]
MLLLTETKITTLSSALSSISKLHALGPNTVIVTSADLTDDAAPTSTPHLHLIASQQRADGPSTQFTVSFPKRSGVFTGTGDLFVALLLAHCSETDLRAACERAVATMQAVLQETVESWGAEATWNDDVGVEGGRKSAAFMRAHELRIVASKRFIEAPEVVYRAVDIPNL